MAQITEERPQDEVPELMTEGFLEVSATDATLVHDQIEIPGHVQFFPTIRTLHPEAVTRKSALLVG
jgi:hypothetical protein